MPLKGVPIMIQTKHCKLLIGTFIALVPCIAIAFMQPTSSASQLNTVTESSTANNITATLPYVTNTWTATATPYTASTWTATATPYTTATATPAPATDVSGFSSGDGTKSNPYVIKSPQQLQNVRTKLDKFFILGADIDMRGVAFEPIGSYSKDGATAFTGVFNGGGYVIRNLKIGDEDKTYQAMFGATKKARILNVKIEDTKVEAKEFGAVLVAYAENTQIETVTVGSTINDASVVIKGGDSLAGIVAHAVGSTSVRYSKANVDIQGGKNLGGVVGTLEKGTSLKEVTSLGIVKGASQVGGVAGSSYGKITGSSSSVAVTSTDEYAGGLVGVLLNSGSIDSSSASGEVTGISNVGGLIGVTTIYYASDQNQPKTAPTPSVKKSTAAGKVKGVVNVGGFLGSTETKTSIKNSDAKGEVTLYKDNKTEKDIGENEASSLGGGFIGTLSKKSIFQTCNTSGNVTGGSLIGGFAGRLEADSSIKSAKVSGIITGGNTVGGVVGESAGNVVGCTVTGDVLQKGLESDGGGVVGVLLNAGAIRSCDVKSRVEGHENIGGIVGRIETYYPEDVAEPKEAATALVDNCLFGGTVMGDTNVGGIVGNATKNAEILTSTMSATIVSEDPDTTGDVIGVIGDKKSVKEANTRFVSAAIKGIR